MGRNAKFYKRIHKKLNPSGASGSQTNTSTPPIIQSQVNIAKKKETLKEKSAKGRRGASAKDGVLGGADYVALMMGSRKKARQEAQKLSQGNS